MSVSKQVSQAPWSGPRRGRHGAVNAGGRRFAPGLWPTALSVLALVVLVGLGTWQLERLAWKRDLIALREVRITATSQPLPADVEDWEAWDFRPVVVHGVLRHDLEQLFGVAASDGRVGHHLLTPLVRPDGSPVLVDRGWVPADRSHSGARREGQRAGPVQVTGIARFRDDDRPGWFTPDNQPTEHLWYWYDLPALEAALGLELLPVVVEADAMPDPRLPIGRQTQIELPNNHLPYAITWYGLAAGLFVIWVGFGLARGRER